jgi:hypothetical protein
MDPNTSHLTTDALVLGGMFASIAGALLSLAMKYVPGLNAWYAKQSKEKKSFVMGIMLVIAALGVAFWTCSDGACAGNGDWRVYLMALFSAGTSNQAVHQITPAPEKLKGPHEGQP